MIEQHNKQTQKQRIKKNWNQPFTFQISDLQWRCHHSKVEKGNQWEQEDSVACATSHAPANISLERYNSGDEENCLEGRAHQLHRTIVLHLSEWEQNGVALFCHLELKQFQRETEFNEPLDWENKNSEAAWLFHHGDVKQFSVQSRPISPPLVYTQTPIKKRVYREENDSSAFSAPRSTCAYLCCWPMRVAAVPVHSRAHSEDITFGHAHLPHGNEEPIHRQELAHFQTANEIHRCCQCQSPAHSCGWKPESWCQVCELDLRPRIRDP